MTTDCSSVLAQLTFPLVQYLECFEWCQAVGVDIADGVQQRMFERGKQCQLYVTTRWFRTTDTDLGASLLVQMFGFELSQISAWRVH